MKMEKLTIEYKDYKLIMSYSLDRIFELSFALYYIDPNSNKEKYVLDCRLDGLWEEELNTESGQGFDFDKEGDYFQGQIDRRDKEFKLTPNPSFTAILHEIFRKNRNKFTMIKNIYSTSKLSENSFSCDAKTFWGKQVDSGFAVWIESEERYKAILPKVRRINIFGL